VVDEAHASWLGGPGYRNLDDEPEFASMNATTEALARVVADRPADERPL
jgi:hypothetical protein